MQLFWQMFAIPVHGQDTRQVCAILYIAQIAKINGFGPEKERRFSLSWVVDSKMFIRNKIPFCFRFVFNFIRFVIQKILFSWICQFVPHSRNKKYNFIHKFIIYYNLDNNLNSIFFLHLKLIFTFIYINGVAENNDFRNTQPLPQRPANHGRKKKQQTNKLNRFEANWMHRHSHGMADINCTKFSAL